MHESLRRMLLRLYPRAWRDRYGAEFTALLEDVGGGWRSTLDVLRQGMAMRMRSSNLRLAVTLSAAGLVVATGIAVRLPVQYRASAVVRISAVGIPHDALVSEVVSAMSRITDASSGRVLVSGKFHDGVAMKIEYPGDTPAKALSGTQAMLSRAIAEMRGIGGPEGSLLEILDTPRLPTRAFRPNRAVVAASGIPAGLLLCSIVLLTRRLLRRSHN